MSIRIESKTGYWLLLPNRNVQLSDSQTIEVHLNSAELLELKAELEKIKLEHE